MRKGDNSISGFAMRWNPLSEDDRRSGRPRNTWRKSVEIFEKLGGRGVEAIC